jgi:hypothetical protein
MQLSKNAPSCATFITLQRRPLLVLLGAGVIHPNSQLKLQIGTTQKSTKFWLGHLSWFPYLPEDKFGHAFDMSPINPSLVRRVLSSNKATSSPGPNELMYGVLLRLPSTHSFLSTLFSQLLLEDPDPTAKWCQSEIKLIYNQWLRQYNEQQMTDNNMMT